MAADHLQVTRPAMMADAAFRDQIAKAGGTITHVSHDGQRYLVGFDGTKPDTMPRLRQALQAAQVPICEPDYVVRASDTVPNDPSYAQMWALHNTGQTGGVAGADIHAQQAWSVSTGSTNVVVAVIDTGMDLTHPDLVGNLWTNAAELAGNGIDDDHDGYIDDVHGWNFVADSSDPTDDYFHGTHCSGIIGATGNNGTGVVGVCWHVSLMPLKFLDQNGNGFTSDAVEAIYFANAHHVQVMSMSWGGLDDSVTLKAAIDDAGTHGILCVAAAGNSANNADISPEYPAAFTSSNLISVLATDATDQRAYFSNAGAGSVDVGAPGVDVLSTLPMIATAQMRTNGLCAGYGLLSGTSMATPHVAGACALLWSNEPSLTAAQVKLRVLQSADRLSSLAGLCVSEGRLDLDRLLRNTTSGWVFAGITGPIGDWFQYHRPVATDFPLTGTAEAAGLTGFTVEVGSGATPTTWTTSGVTLAGGGLQPVTEGVLAQCHVAAFAEGFWTVRLTVTGSGGSRVVTRTLWVDPALKPGFPTLAPQLAGSDSQIFLGVTLADLMGSGHLDLIGSAQSSGPLYAVGPDGANLPGWPLKTVGAAYPTVGDVDGDGHPDIAFGTFATSGPPWGVVDRTGAFLPGWPKANANYTAVSPALADLDGDGRCEIVTTNNDLYVSVLRGDGTSMPGWPQRLISGQAATGHSVVDLDGDGIPEIVVIDAGSTAGVYIDAWRLDGSPAPGFPHLYQTANSGTSRFALGDIDHDGKVDIVFNGGSRGFVYAINGDGMVKPGWPVTITDGGTFPECSAPALADLFGDGKLEIIIAYYDSFTSNLHVMAWRPDGTAVPGWPVIMPEGFFLGAFSPAVGDIDGDGQPDIVMGRMLDESGNSLLAAYDAGGHMLPGWPKTKQLGSGTPLAIADIDGDGRNELVVLSSLWSGHNMLAPLLYAWDFNAPGTRSGRVEWGQLAASASHRHLYRAPGDVPTLSNQTLTVAAGTPLPFVLGGACADRLRALLPHRHAAGARHPQRQRGDAHLCARSRLQRHGQRRHHPLGRGTQHWSGHHRHHRDRGQPGPDHSGHHRQPSARRASSHRRLRSDGE
ncbi:MAG: S8 family serine peptidase [Planctomycetes bacterium]|nr:S8 family serine peptidase [Planctomycetota bacterium]